MTATLCPAVDPGKKREDGGNVEQVLALAMTLVQVVFVTLVALTIMVTLAHTTVMVVCGRNDLKEDSVLGAGELEFHPDTFAVSMRTRVGGAKLELPPAMTARWDTVEVFLIRVTTVCMSDAYSTTLPEFSKQSFFPVDSKRNSLGYSMLPTFSSPQRSTRSLVHDAWRAFARQLRNVHRGTAISL